MNTWIMLSPLLLAWLAVRVSAFAGRFRTGSGPKTAALMGSLVFAGLHPAQVLEMIKSCGSSPECILVVGCEPAITGFAEGG